MFWRRRLTITAGPPAGPEQKEGLVIKTTEQIINAERMEQVVSLFGSFDANIRLVEQKFGVTVLARGTDIKVSGEPEDVARAVRAIDGLLELMSRGEQLDEQKVRYVLMLVSEGAEDAVGRLSSDSICITAKGKPVKPKTLGQKNYVEAIGKNTVTIGVGPAGTGKTYLAVAMAVRAFRAKEISRIILTRPAVEAGEKLGFLPGERGDIEIAPLAYMRGRTLDDSFIILDEAQNTTPEQMKMFLTRLGFNSRMVVTGDVTQIDLPVGKLCGLKQVMQVLDGVQDVAICRFSHRDVVRHELVQRIIAAYERYDRVRGDSRKDGAAAGKPARPHGDRPAGARPRPKKPERKDERRP